MKQPPLNKSMETNRRLMNPLGARGGKLGCAVRAQAPVSAAVAHLKCWAATRNVPS